ncbi:MAG: nucleotidyl transferase AbiEii/AbiGii toxin family protein, partial [Lentisphaeraceae bacterium]|nr:nucleotidyl transferase AbiEii/AbiGii toxin family protein [Lentisphaeraceae bacterium]
MTAKKLDLDTHILQIRYSLERFLYRLSLTKHNERITLKGGMLFILWCEETFRPTRDVDFLISGDSDHETIKQVIIDICDVKVAEDDA